MITDEQSKRLEEIRRIMNTNNEFWRLQSGDHMNMVYDMLEIFDTSEQAWKEENAKLNSWLKNAEAKEREYDNLARRFNRAIEVLKNSRSDIVRLIADYPNEMWLDEDKQAWEDVGNMGIASIDRFLSSLQEDKS